MTPTPDTPDLGGLVAAMIAMTVISLLVAAAVYVWTGLAMSRLFGRLSIEPWRGWVPLLNLAEVLALGGTPKWVALLFLVPLANIYALVRFAMAAHRVNALFGRGAGMTVLAVLLLPVWASVLAWGRATPDPERGRLADVLGRQTQPTGPLALPPEPVAPRAEAPAGERAFPPLPGLEQREAVRPGAQAPADLPAPTGRPAAGAVPPPPSPITAPPGVAAGWPASPPVSSVPPTAAPAPAAAAPASTAAAPAAAPAPAPSASFAPPTGQPVQPEAGVPAHPGASAQPPAPHSLPAHPAPPQPVADRLPTAPWAPPADRAQPAAPAPAEPVHADPSPAVPQSAPAPATPLPATPLPATPLPAAALAPTPLPPAPVGDPHPAPFSTHDESDGLDFADAATIIASGDDGAADDEGDVEATVVVDRRPRREWRLVLDDGDVLPITGEVVVLGRNPAAGDGEQRLAVPDRTRTLSKTHARLVRSSTGWTITDLGSTNGVLIGGAAGEELLIDAHVETPVDGRFVLGEVGMQVTEATA